MSHIWDAFDGFRFSFQQIYHEYEPQTMWLSVCGVHISFVLQLNVGIEIVTKNNKDHNKGLILWKKKSEKANKPNQQRYEQMKILSNLMNYTIGM